MCYARAMEWVGPAAWGQVGTVGGSAPSRLNDEESASHPLSGNLVPRLEE